VTPVVSTPDLALAAWWWTHGLEFSRCDATDRYHAALVFTDPAGRATQLAAEFRQQRELRDFLAARRRLCFAIRMARVKPGGIATRHHLDHFDRRLRPALRAAAQAASS